MTDPKSALAARLLPLIDLTSLNDARDDDIAGLCRAAQTPHGPVAAVCSWPVFAGAAKERLSGAGIAVAAVLNFPEGKTPLAAVLEEAEAAMAAGAEELDLVWPYQAWLAGERRRACAMIEAVKGAAQGRARLKVILETAALGGAKNIAGASREAIAAGADFLKTSTGKAKQGGASLAAAEVMLEAIAAVGRGVGFKASGGIRSPREAGEYLALAERKLGPDWPGPQRFRIGASGLLSEILNDLGAVESLPAGQA
jgi:deoxyribose-phosphate aldolase